MKLSLPFRIFLYHLVLMLALGALTALVIQHLFERYAEDWEREVSTLGAEQLFTPLATEVARSLLLQLGAAEVPESGEQDRSGIAKGLDAVLPTIPSVDSLVVVDETGRVLYGQPEFAGASHDIRADGLEGVATLDRPVRSEIRLPSGDLRREVRLPLTAESDGEQVPLGGLVIRYVPDSRLEPGAPTDPEAMLTPWLAPIARALLREAKRSGDEHRAEAEAYAGRVSEGLEAVLPSIPALDSLVIVDPEGRIRYAHEAIALDLRYTGEEYAARFAAEDGHRHDVTLQDGSAGFEWIYPVKPSAEATSAERLGSILIRYRPDPALQQRLPDLRPPSVGPGRYTKPLILFLAVAFAGGIVLAALSGVPVRRLERALEDYRARGFKGALDAKGAGLDRDLEPAVRAINELGGKLQALDAKGREREALLATLSQSLEEGMIALDATGTPVAWNPAAARQLVAPVEKDDEAGARPGAGAIVEALDRNPDLRFAVDRVHDAATREVELVRGDGTRVPAQITRVPFEVRPGESGTLLLIRDLATLRKVEAHLLEAGRFAVLAHLAAGLAHEIRNPLHSIRINATAAEQYIDPPGESEESRAVVDSLETIKSETERLADLLNNYLGMVRPEKLSEWVDLRELCRRVVQLVGYTARKSHIEIAIEGDGDLPLVRGVPDRLQQAILNLVLNAIQAMPEGGKLSIRTDRAEGVVRVTVRDTGPGLDLGLADQLFDTRVTTKPEGSGLGLPLVRMIVEAHGGSVWYRSGPDRGATFTLVLPAEAAG